MQLLETPTSARGNEQLQGVERAKEDLEVQLKLSQTVGDMRTNTHEVLTELERNGDAEGIEFVQKYEKNLNNVAEGHDSVTLENFEGGLQGLNEVGTRNSTIGKHLLQTDHLLDTKGTEMTDEVLDHEDDVKTGHAGQIPGREGLVLSDGEVLEGVKLYEGENEAQQAIDKRGDAGAAREGQPEKDYGEGQRAVAKEGVVPISDYLRDGKSRIDTQVAIFKNSGMNRTQMFEALRKGNYSEDDALEVIQKAA